MDKEKGYARIVYNNKYFRNNIDFLLVEKNLTRKKLESYLDIGYGALSRYCKCDENAIKPSIEIVNSIAKFFNVTIDELINKDLKKQDQNNMIDSKRKEVLFCKKLIDNTKNNLCDWKYDNRDNDLYSLISYEEDKWTYDSKFLYDLYDANHVSGFYITVDADIKVLIVKISKYELNSPDLDWSYELYLIKNDGKIIPSCSSHKYNNDLSKFLGEEIIYDDTLYNVLKEVHELASDYVAFGKDNYEKKLIYDKYLDLIEI